MAADLIVAPGPRPRVDPSPAPLLPGVRLLGFTGRGGFILLPAAMVARANLPQNARFRAIREAPACRAPRSASPLAGAPLTLISLTTMW